MCGSIKKNKPIPKAKSCNVETASFLSLISDINLNYAFFKHLTLNKKNVLNNTTSSGFFLNQIGQGQVYT